ncbi:fumarylacetoacetate hydrolase family protein [uncultured Methylobacterium sp.]|jgi:2-keto-4-pentenoate hydratase|uniref:2-keto-4-pentenoate hydratase n=1 Tax=uncultured Methylobacterium sp. TaxID=157278 RepID=UPI0026047123|nr:fumarylacetoacetate hydrolase family protein [uncultured Methylobacterium sp.]
MDTVAPQPTADQRAASELLWRHWQEQRRLPALPERLRPRSRGEGYAIQALLHERDAAPLFGWKIAATSPAGQAHIGVDGPLAGRILASRVVAAGGTVPFGRNHMRVAEVEVAFRLGRTLPPRAEPYGVDEVLDAVGSVHPAIEVPDSRYDDFVAAGAPQLIADNACAHWFVLGAPATAPWRTLDLAALETRGTVSGRDPVLGRGGNVLGDPRAALAWLVNEVSGLGLPLRAGEVVTTGTTTVPLAIAPGDAVTADLGPLGTVTMRLGPEE